MNPDFTTHMLRKIHQELGTGHRVSASGHPEGPSSFPRVDGETPATFAKSYFAYNLSRKLEEEADAEKLKYSLEKWVNAEHTCLVVNRHGRAWTPVTNDLKAAFSEASRLATACISRVLTEVWPEFRLEPTGGATNIASRQFSCAGFKSAGTPVTHGAPANIECVSSAEHLYTELLEQNKGFHRRCENGRWNLVLADLATDASPADTARALCSANRPAVLDYVDKDNKSVRLIAKSGGGTIMVQKAFGTAIRCALKERVGVNLNDQSINQRWARKGSIDGSVATVDLSSASDSIALGHLRFFPKRWQEYFLSCRDASVRVGAHTHTLQMVAGMGNGYIFELESLLFYALARGVVEYMGLDVGSISVYGDDIIIPSEAYGLFSEYMSHLGFTINPDKSFATGRFRESCGKHYFDGVDVTPVYLRKRLRGDGEVHHFHNGLSDWCNRTGWSLESSLALLAKAVHRNHRNVVPGWEPSRAGFYNCVEGARLPVFKWDKRLHSDLLVYERLVEGPSRDASERFDGWLLLNMWLHQAETHDAVQVPCKPVRSRRYSDYFVVREFRRPKVVWGDETVAEYRQHKWPVRVIGDATGYPEQE